MSGITKMYGNVRALAAVDFSLRAGEVMALLGENGAGKSTLVKVLAGMVQPDAGRIEIDGVLTDLSSGRSQRTAVAVVQQELSSVPSMSVAENLVLGRPDAPLVWTAARLRARALPLLRQVGLEHIDPSRLVSTLSLAERQLVEVARVLAGDARILVFDEPTAALSDAEITRVLDLVRSLAAEGRSVIYVTHRLREVFEVCDRVTVFRNGESQAALPVADLDVEAVITMMLGRRLEAMYPHRLHHTALEESSTLEVRGLFVDGMREPASLLARGGEIIGVTGQIGSGASEFMQAIAAERTAAAGEVVLNGKRVDLRSRRAGIAAGIAYCSGDRKTDGIFAKLAVETNLTSPWLERISRFGVLRRRVERRRAEEVARSVSFDPKRIRTLVGQLSGGNQQKVALGKWLGRDPDVLLIEEPTRGVDVGARAEIYAQLRKAANAGALIVIGSSDTAEVFGLCDRIGTFYRGVMNTPRPHHEYTEESLAFEVMHSRTAAPGAAQGDMP